MTMKKKILISTIGIVLLFFLLFLLFRVDQQDDNNINPDEILKSVELKYAALKTYHDSGHITTSYKTSSKFETYYIDSNGEKSFLYKWSLKKPDGYTENYLFCKNENGVFVEEIDSNPKSIEKFDTLFNGIASVHPITEAKDALQNNLII